MNIPLYPYVPENLVSGDLFSRLVLHQPAHLHTQTESGAYLRGSSRVPRRRPFMKPPYAIGSVPSLSGHAIAYRWCSLPRVRRHRANKTQGSSERVLPRQVTMDQLIFASLSHTHYWYEVGMLKVLFGGKARLSFSWRIFSRVKKFACRSSPHVFVIFPLYGRYPHPKRSNVFSHAFPNEKKKKPVCVPKLFRQTNEKKVSDFFFFSSLPFSVALRGMHNKTCAKSLPHKSRNFTVLEIFFGVRRPGNPASGINSGSLHELPKFCMNQPFDTKRNRALVTPWCIFRLSCVVLSGGLYDARADNDERWSCLVGRALRRESGQR